MNVPIRMIGIATTFFWIFLIAFIASAVYSVKDLRFGFGEPIFTIAPTRELVFSLPIEVENRGYYSISSFNVTTEFSGADGSVITRESTLVPLIPKGRLVTVLHNVTLNFDDMLENNEQYLFNDSEMRIAASVGMNFAEILPAEVSTNFSFPWGAPFYNLAFGQPEYTALNSTHQTAMVPVSFENHASFDLAGNIKLKIYNDAGVLLGENETAFDVPQYSPYNGSFEFCVPTAEITPSGHFEFYFVTPLFDYGPVVVPYG